MCVMTTGMHHIGFFALINGFCLLAKDTGAVSLIGNASISARKAITGPGFAPLIHRLHRFWHSLYVLQYRRILILLPVPRF